VSGLTTGSTPNRRVYAVAGLGRYLGSWAARKDPGSAPQGGLFERGIGSREGLLDDDLKLEARLRVFGHTNQGAASALFVSAGIVR